LDGRPEDQAKRIARAWLGEMIDRFADDHLWIGAAAQDRAVEMEFDAVSREGNGRDLPADQVGWLLQQRISRSLPSFLWSYASGLLSQQ
jgi:hypothetical protein